MLQTESVNSPFRDDNNELDGITEYVDVFSFFPKKNCEHWERFFATYSQHDSKGLKSLRPRKLIQSTPDVLTTEL